MCAAGASAQSPGEGPGGPTLVIANSATPFSRYYAEILRAEGMNAFAVRDVANVTPAILADAGATLANAYIRVDASKPPGAGIVSQTMQFHGTADRYALNGATSVADLYSSESAATTAPAVTLRNVGGAGGSAAAFTYDLAKSVVQTRQGNPEWKGQERDGRAPIRSNDLFFGAASFDPQPNWIDLSKVAIPQADEQQRLLANLIGQVTADKKPLPRFWYLPRGAKAVTAGLLADAKPTQENAFKLTLVERTLDAVLTDARS